MQSSWHAMIASMAIHSLDHVNLRTPDLARMRAFYRDLLGLRDGRVPSFQAVRWGQRDACFVTHVNKARPDVFRAIADPTRRAILDRLRAGPTPVNAPAVDFRQSRPAISKHLRVLRGAALVSERRLGRERLLRAAPEIASARGELGRGLPSVVARQPQSPEAFP